jgi:hypothetical protein
MDRADNHDLPGREHRNYSHQYLMDRYDKHNLTGNVGIIKQLYG